MLSPSLPVHYFATWLSSPPHSSRGFCSPPPGGGRPKNAGRAPLGFPHPRPAPPNVVVLTPQLSGLGLRDSPPSGSWPAASSSGLGFWKSPTAGHWQPPPPAGLRFLNIAIPDSGSGAPLGRDPDIPAPRALVPGLPKIAILIPRPTLSAPSAMGLTVGGSGWVSARSPARPSPRSRWVLRHELSAGGCDSGPLSAGERLGEGDCPGRAPPSSAPSRPGGGMRRPVHPQLRPVLPPRRKLTDASSFIQGWDPHSPLSAAKGQSSWERDTLTPVQFFRRVHPRGPSPKSFRRGRSKNKLHHRPQEWSESWPSLPNLICTFRVILPMKSLLHTQEGSWNTLVTHAPDKNTFYTDILGTHFYTIYIQPTALSTRSLYSNDLSTHKAVGEKREFHIYSQTDSSPTILSIFYHEKNILKM